MQGTILSFELTSNTGLISGFDGTRYEFTRNDLNDSSKTPSIGQTVDFENDGKTAKKIIVVTKAAGGKSRVSAILLAFFLGAFGGHKFYLGQIGLGIIYLLFFWTLIPSLIAFVEFILLVVMNDEEFNRRYNQ